MRSVKRRILLGLLLGVMVAVPTVAAASAASAEPGSVTCPAGSSTATYDPPLTNTPKMTDIAVHRELLTCVSPTHPQITTGHMDWSATLPAASCTNLTAPATVNDAIHWNTGETSSVTLNTLSSTVLGVTTTTFTGSVTSGPFDGSTVVMVQVAASLDGLRCSTTGVASQHAPLLTLQITSL